MHEGVIDRSDGKQPLAEQAVRQARRTQKQKQVHLCDAQFDMLAFRRKFPFCCRNDAMSDESVCPWRPCEKLAPVHPRPKIGCSRYIWWGRDDPHGERAVALGQIIEDLPKGSLR